MGSVKSGGVNPSGQSVGENLEIRIVFNTSGDDVIQISIPKMQSGGITQEAIQINVPIQQSGITQEAHNAMPKQGPPATTKVKQNNIELKKKVTELGRKVAEVRIEILEKMNSTMVDMVAAFSSMNDNQGRRPSRLYIVPQLPYCELLVDAVFDE